MSRAPEESEGGESTEWAPVSSRDAGKRGQRLAVKHQDWENKVIGEQIFRHTPDHAKEGK